MYNATICHVPNISSLPFTCKSHPTVKKRAPALLLHNAGSTSALLQRPLSGLCRAQADPRNVDLYGHIIEHTLDFAAAVAIEVYILPDVALAQGGFVRNCSSDERPNLGTHPSLQCLARIRQPCRCENGGPQMTHDLAMATNLLQLPDVSADVGRYRREALLCSFLEAEVQCELEFRNRDLDTGEKPLASCCEPLDLILPCPSEKDWQRLDGDSNLRLQVVQPWKNLFELLLRLPRELDPTLLRFAHVQLQHPAKHRGG
mmetsp:Transcript_48806/g.123808  ORF Transcript_48806/g.123808 Transcript_48806/m.123808 type:complete len:259 (+) Transcript_48806:124-900(+)